MELSKEEIIKIVVKAIQDEKITIKDIVRELIPKKENKTKDMNAYMKNYYAKNKEYIIQQVLAKRNLKKRLLQVTCTHSE